MLDKLVDVVRDAGDNMLELCPSWSLRRIWALSVDFSSILAQNEVELNIPTWNRTLRVLLSQSSSLVVLSACSLLAK
jgi:hypothetical protein